MTDFLAPAASDGIEESVRRHDRMQFETKMEFRYDPGLVETPGNSGTSNSGTGTRPTTGASQSPNSPRSPQAWRRWLSNRLHRANVALYDVEMFFFLPYNLGLNSLTYPKNMFYGDVQSYVRVKRPNMSLAQILGGPGSPAGRLEAAAADLGRTPDTLAAARFEHETRMFCCVAAKSLFNHVLSVLDRHDPADTVGLTETLCAQMRAVLERYRALRAGPLDPAAADGEALAIHRFGDEYLSLRVEHAAFDLLRGFRHAAGLDGARACVAQLAREEAEYRRTHHYGSVPERDSDNETTIFRAGVLKKYIGSVLYLNTRLGREQQVVEQVLLGVAAGGAMLFATGVVFYFQFLYGALTVPFFLAAIVSYMFKDRIKDMLRYYLTAQAGNRLFDHQTNIFAGSGEKVGVGRESVDFLKEGKVPPEVARVRRKERLTEIENRLTGESVIRYRKRIGILTAQFAKVFSHAQVDGLTDITRFSVQHFVRKMDDPRQTVFVANDDGTYDRLTGRHVYHVNLVIRYGQRGRDAVYRRYRIVLTRKGIRRIEEIA